jgi:hypothetical protein
MLATALLLALTTLLATWRHTPLPGAPSLPKSTSAIGPLPLSFEPNAGQTDPAVHFTVHAKGGTLFFTPSEVVLTLAAQGVSEDAAKSGAAAGLDRASLVRQKESKVESGSVRLQFVGSNPAATISQGEALPGKVSYFLGRDPAQWHANLPTYSGLTYSGLYPGVSLEYAGADGQLKGTYTLAAGADPSLIKWRYAGADKAAVDGAGNLQISLSSANSALRTPHSAFTVTEQAPQAWQTINGERVAVSSRYAVQPDGTIGFQLGDYDRSQPLTIDPTLTYSTYLGGFFGDWAQGIGLDGSGNIYVSGVTSSSDFPTVNAYQSVYGGDQYDSFVSKISADGSTLLYSTFLGGEGWDQSEFVSVDTSGQATVGGWTSSVNFPTTAGAYQTDCGNNESITITRLNASGSGLVFSTCYGDAVIEPGGFTVDAAGKTYFTGFYYATTNRYALVSALSADGSDIVVETQLGGEIAGPGNENSDTGGRGITLDSAGNIYVTGYTRAANFPTTPGAYRTNIQQFEDGFLTKLNPTGQTLLYSTFIPGGVSEYPNDVAVDGAGNAYVTGSTSSGDYPTTPGAFQTVKGDPTIAFVTKFNSTGSALAYSTFLGDTSFHFDTEDITYAIRVNGAGNAYVAGYSSSPGYPVANPIQANLRGDFDAIVTKLNPAGSTLEFSTYLGGTDGDVSSGLVVDASGKMYIAGGTSSTDFPVVNPVQATHHGSGDAFIAVISEATAPTVTPTRTGTPPTATSTPCVPGATSWRTEPPMTEGRDYAIGAVAGDKFYMIGGSQPGREPPYVEVVERFDPATMTWATVAPIPVAADDMAAASIGNKIYVAGGYTVRQGFTIDLMQIYDASTNSWSQGSHLPARTSSASAAAYNGKVYIFGGGETTTRNTVYEYDPATDTYATKAPMPTVESQTAAATIGNKIYVVGGYRHDAYAHYIYDPVADTWSTTAPPLTPSFAWAGAFALNDELWVVGGYDNFTRQGYPPSQEVHIYNPVTNSWRFGPAFNTPRTRTRAAGAINGRGYVAGGVDLLDDDVLLTSLESITYSSCSTATAQPTSTRTSTASASSTAVASQTATSGAIATSSSTASASTPTVISTATACAITFSDVPEGSTFYPFVRCLACQGIIGGYEDGTFRPGNDVTRGQLSKIVANAAGFNEPVGGQTFEDVPPDSTFFLFIERMAALGIIGGYPCGEAGEPCGPENRPYFRPAANATRGQISKIVASSTGINDPVGEQRFEDVLPGSAFYSYVQMLANLGVMSGYPCGGEGEPCGVDNKPYFRPGNNATRGQTSKIVSNTFFPDCQTPSRR